MRVIRHKINKIKQFTEFDSESMKNSLRIFGYLQNIGRTFWKNCVMLFVRNDFMKQYIRERLKRLSDECIVTNIGSGNYELNPEAVPSEDTG